MNLERITFDPQIMGGKPTIRGMRVTVSTIVGLVVSGISLEEILTSYPYLEKGDIEQALKYNGIYGQAEPEFSDDRIFVEQYNRELDDALKRIRNGEYLTQEEVERSFDEEI